MHVVCNFPLRYCNYTSPVVKYVMKVVRKKKQFSRSGRPRYLKMLYIFTNSSANHLKEETIH